MASFVWLVKGTPNLEWFGSWNDWAVALPCCIIFDVFSGREAGRGRVIVRSQPGPSVVDPSRLDGCGVERINRFAVWRGERKVHRTDRHFLLHDPEVLIVDREAGPLRAFDDPDTEGLQRPLIERATPCDVAYWQLHMIKQHGGPPAPVKSPALGEGSLSWASVRNDA